MLYKVSKKVCQAHGKAFVVIVDHEENINEQRRGGGAMGVIVIWMLMVLASLCTLATTYKVLTDYLASPATQHPLSDDFIDNINNLAVSWEAGRNFHRETSMDVIIRKMGVKYQQTSTNFGVPVISNSNGNASDIPTNFDAREHWPQCETLREIRDQGGCGSCWAISSVATMSDRYCISNNKTIRFSVEDLLTCSMDDGCDGGFPAAAFSFWQTKGIVSGGPYGSKNTCRPYQIQPCEHHVNGTRPECGDEKTPKCVETCQPQYNLTYQQDKHFASNVYSTHNFESTSRELATNGPLVASYAVYEDFLSYKSGIYHHVAGNFLGLHAVKVIGYGVKEGIPYYICANSWNYDWGDGGFFKIRSNEMDRELVSGMPKRQ